MDVREVIAQRPDLSTFLVHLCRSTPKRTAKETLKSILAQQELKAKTTFGHAKRTLEAPGVNLKSQRCVCFTETPLEHLHLLTAAIENRQFQFEPYGIAITKRQGRVSGINPVWYVT